MFKSFSRCCEFSVIEAENFSCRDCCSSLKLSKVARTLRLTSSNASFRFFSRKSTSLLLASILERRYSISFLYAPSCSSTPARAIFCCFSQASWILPADSSSIEVNSFILSFVTPRNFSICSSIFLTFSFNSGSTASTFSIASLHSCFTRFKVFSAVTTDSWTSLEIVFNLSESWFFTVSIFCWITTLYFSRFSSDLRLKSS